MMYPAVDRINLGLGSQPYH